MSNIIYNIEDEIRDLEKNLKEMKINYESTFFDFSTEHKLVNSTMKSNMQNMKFALQKTILIPVNKKIESTSKNHFTSLFWGGEGSNYPNQIAATTNKGVAYIFNTNQKLPVHEFNFTNSQLHACCIEPTENNLFAAGGFDGGIYVTNINNAKSKDKKEEDGEFKKFSGHQGVVSCCRFLNNNFLISSSNDSVILLWDINSQGKFINSYHDHTSEVSGLDVNDLNGNIFATGSGDTTVKLFDIREKKPCVCTFKGSNSSVSCVKFLPGRLTTLAAGSEDSTIRVYDLRALKELASLKKDGEFNSINSIGFSKSGQVLFASSNNSSKIHFWDIFNDANIPFSYFENTTQKDKALSQAAIDSNGVNIAFISDDSINIIK